MPCVTQPGGPDVDCPAPPSLALAHGIAGAALAWNLLGLALFAMRVTMTPERVAALSPADRAMVDGTPGWVLVAFGTAVVTGVLGSVGLLARRRWAAAAFAVSLAALLVQVVGTFAATPAWSAYGPAGLFMPALLLAVAVFLWRHAGRVHH